MTFGIKGYGALSPLLRLDDDYGILRSCRDGSKICNFNSSVVDFISYKEFMDKLPIRIHGDVSFYYNDNRLFNLISQTMEGLVILKDKSRIEFGKMNPPSQLGCEIIKNEDMEEEFRWAVHNYLDVHSFINEIKVFRFGKMRKLILHKKEVLYTSSRIPHVEIKNAKESDTLKLFNRLKKIYLNPSKVEFLSGDYATGVSVKIKNNPLALFLAPVSTLNKNYMHIYTLNTDAITLKPSKARWNTVESHFNKLKEYYLNQSI